MVLWGQGEVHLRVALERLQGKFGVHAKSQPRRIGYKETIKKSVQLRGRHKKQSGGHGQYGDVTVEIKPLPRGSGFVFTDTITGGVVPKQYIPAVEAGVREWMVQGLWDFQWSTSPSIFRKAPTMMWIHRKWRSSWRHGWR